MHILFCTHVYPPDRGGIAAFSKDMVGLLQRLGHEVRIFNYKNSGERQNLKNLFNRSYARCQFYAISSVGLIKMLLSIRSFRPKFVMCSTWRPYGLFAALLRNFFGYRLIIQVHGTEISGNLKTGWRRKILSTVLKSADMLWPVSFYTAQLLSIYDCKEYKIKIVRPFLPAEALQAAESFQNVKNRQPPIILTVANLYPRKGIDLVLKALSNLKDLSWQYMVVGEAHPPWSREHYERLAMELGIKKRVTFLGQISRQRVWRLMEQSYMFVMPSRAMEDDIESFGIVYIEAQLFNLPCIGTKFGGIPEAVQDGVTGVLIENQDIKGLTSAIEMLLEDLTKAKEMGKNGRKRVFHLFSEDARSETVMSLLRTANCK
jgi:phosphatidylinositol alpha-1,6-mannosyltransferase